MGFGISCILSKQDLSPLLRETQSIAFKRNECQTIWLPLLLVISPLYFMNTYPFSYWMVHILIGKKILIELIFWNCGNISMFHKQRKCLEKIIVLVNSFRIYRGQPKAACDRKGEKYNVTKWYCWLT